MVLAFAAAAAVAGEPTVASGKPAGSQARNPIDRWNQMSPEERERELAKLPPERARQIRERIRRYNQLPPREKQALREGYRKFSQLPPEKQEIVRQSHALTFASCPWSAARWFARRSAGCARCRRHNAARA